MFDLVEELKPNETVFVLLESYDRSLLYGVYEIVSSEYLGFNKCSAHLRLKEAPKKKRYFDDDVIVVGFRINLSTAQRKYKIYGDFDEMELDFCQAVSKNQERSSHKLLKKMKKKFPSFFS